MNIFHNYKETVQRIYKAKKKARNLQLQRIRPNLANLTNLPKKKKRQNKIQNRNKPIQLSRFLEDNS